MNATAKHKLELTWIGKENRPRLEPRILIEDQALSYHAPFRASDADLFDNRLVFGDNLLALKALEAEFTGKIKCIYIDPPFNTQQAMEHYEDGLEHSTWLTLMRDRLEVLHKLLANDGTLFVHIDDNELAYLTAVVDETFGRKNRIAVITFKQSAASGPKSVNPGLVSTSNFILYYAKDKTSWRPNKVFVAIPRDDRYNNFIVNRDDDFGRWQLTTLRQAFAQANGVEPRRLDEKFGGRLEKKLEEFVLAHGDQVVQPALVRPEDINADAREALLESERMPDRVTKSTRENRYFLNGKQLLFYASKTQIIDGAQTTAGLTTTIWDDLLSNNIHKEGGVSFPNGKKPERLLKRVLEIATNPGDWVLDSFAGSGTTGAVAQKIRRRWIMVELGAHCDTHILPRLRSVVDGGDTSGITTSVDWRGGGGFRYYRLAPSLLEKDQFGNWVINRKYNPTMLAEAICKLEGFTYAPSDTVYWQFGRSTEKDFIYITTQTLTREQIQKLSDEVGEGRSLLVMCAAFRVKNLDAFPNLTVKKIPKAVLSRCEWGHDDYSLEIRNLPVKAGAEEPTSGLPAETSAKTGKRPRTKAERRGQTTLFDMDGDKRSQR
jgi:adenine-specific DNA-methyltransferase